MKSSRHEKILELISKYEISTQEELTARLNELGYKTTQATVSRDIKYLQLRKVPSANGQKYTVPDNKPTDEERYLRIFGDALIHMDVAANLLVIRTISGMAMAAAAAVDGLNLEQNVGSIAGDDTIMCACRSPEDAAQLLETLDRLLKEIN